MIIATNNNHKLAEIQAILGPDFRLTTLREVGIEEDIPETQPTIEGNALQKARYAFDRIKENPNLRSKCDSLGGVFADDTGLEVEALNGEPGVHSGRYATESGPHDFPANNALLLKNMVGFHGPEKRRARFRTVIALVRDGQEYTFEGIVEGHITETPSGSEGFGYDPLFIPDGYTKTFADMTPEEKNGLSHRGRAVEKLKKFLQNG